MKLNVYADPGHAWAKVSISLLLKLGIADQISGYSYRRGAFAFLEEDCDLGLFVNAMKQTGRAVEFIEHHTDKRSRIRNYERWTK